MQTTQQPLLTIVVPAYNVSLYLDQCLDSLLNQGLQQEDFEVLVINDGSTDGSDLIAKKWQDRHQSFRLISQENAGLSAARNTGLDAATGKYLIFLDSDDVIPPLTYSRMIETLEKSGSDFVTAPAYRFSSGQRNAWPFIRNIDLFETSRIGLTFNDHPEYIRDFTAWNKMYRRNFFLHSGVRFPEGRIYEDVATSPLLYAKAKRFDVLAFPGYFWRITPGSITQTIKPVKALDRIWAVEHILDFFDRQPKSLELQKEIDFAVIDYNLRWVFLDFFQFEPDAQQKILEGIQRIMSRLSPISDTNFEEPLSTWALLAQQNKTSQLLASLLNHRRSFPPALQNTGKTSRLKRIKARLLQKKNHHLQILGHHSRETKRRLKHLFLYLILRPFLLFFPLDNKRVIFSNYWGYKFSESDGPAAIAICLANMREDFKLVIFTNEKMRDKIQQQVRSLIPPKRKVQIVTNGSISFYRNIWTAKWLFNDVNFPLGFRTDKFVGKRPGQVEVQTTHGIPLKKMGLDSSAAIDPNEVRKFLAKNKRYDYLVSSSPTVADTFSKAHGVTPTILKTGLPQNDFLFRSTSAKEINELKKKYGLNPKKKTIVYAPTFRHGRGYAFRYLIDFQKLSEEIGGDYQIAIKTHPYNHTHLSLIDFKDFTDFGGSGKNSFIKLFGEVREDPHYLPAVVDDEIRGSSVPEKHFCDADINELLLVADLLITDYSSLMFSYMHLNKPLILFTPDAESYSNARGMYFDIDRIAPGAVAKSTDDLIVHIASAHDPQEWAKIYSKEINAFKDRFLIWEKGDAAKNILQQIGLIVDT